MNPLEIDVVCFHYPCQDGLGSAWVAYKFATENNLTYQYVPMSHSKTSEFDFKDKNVAFFDYAPTDELIVELEKSAKDYYILDHHVTNEQRLKDCSKCIFDMNRSGAGLAWDYYYPNTEMPKFLQMIQDRDLWKFTIPETKAFSNGLYTYTSMTKSIDESFKLFDELYVNPSKYEEIMKIGEILENKKQNRISGLANYVSKKTYSYNNLKVAIVNCDHELASDLGNHLVSNYDYDFAVCWRYDHLKEEYWLSLRSNGDMDVSQICKEYGGGGHKNASGCSTKIHPSVLFNNIKNTNEENEENDKMDIDD